MNEIIGWEGRETGGWFKIGTIDLIINGIQFHIVCYIDGSIFVDPHNDCICFDTDRYYRVYDPYGSKSQSFAAKAGFDGLKDEIIQNIKETYDWKKGRFPIQ